MFSSCYLLLVASIPNVLDIYCANICIINFKIHTNIFLEPVVLFLKLKMESKGGCRKYKEGFPDYHFLIFPHLYKIDKTMLTKGGF